MKDKWEEASWYGLIKMFETLARQQDDVLEFVQTDAAVQIKYTNELLEQLGKYKKALEKTIAAKITHLK